MYTIYSIREGKLETVPRITRQNAKTLNNIWINIKAPTPEDFEELRPLAIIPDEVISDVRDVNEVPKLDRADDYTYILVQTPVAAPHADPNHPSQLEYAVAPLAILWGERHLITISWGNSDVVAYLENKLKNIGHNHLVDTTKPSQFILKLFLFTAKIYLRYLKDIYNRLQLPLSESAIATFDKDIVGLLKIEQSLVYFDTSLRSNYIVMEKISRRKQFVESEEELELAEDVLHESRQAVEVVKVYGHIVEDIRNALSSLISNNLNRSVNWLTKITLILMVPTFVATLYGMNVPLPFAHSTYAFWITIGLSLLVTFGVILWLNRYSGGKSAEANVSNQNQTTSPKVS